MRAYAKSLGVEGMENAPRGKVLAELFEQTCEDKLVQPTFITGYPVEISPLARRSKERPELTERFELYISGMEIAN